MSKLSIASGLVALLVSPFAYLLFRKHPQPDPDLWRAQRKTMYEHLEAREKR